MKIQFVIGFVLLISSVFGLGQSFDMNRSWESLGPNEKPSSPTKINASGIGPVEFIRISPSKPEILLAGSLSGGLFVSEDRGEFWFNAGSDSWDYSGCGWADFYPQNHLIWFAYSNVDDNNGKPGVQGSMGGIMRTMDGGINWQKIASAPTRFGSEHLAVYGFRFLPSNPKKMFVLTDDGLFYTDDCLANDVIWKKNEYPAGYVYDLDFYGDYAYVSSMQFGKWNVWNLNLESGVTKAVKGISELQADKRSITCEPIGDELLILVDYSKNSDELFVYNPASDSLIKFLSNQQVNFGSGNTFAVNPHSNQDFLLGFSTSIKHWNYQTGKEIKIGGGYHVDVEFAVFDPIDSNRIYLACHGGVYISTDAGRSWTDKSNGLSVAEVMGLDVSETDPNQVVIGTFHDGSSVLADWEKNGQYSWRTVNGGDALIPFIHPDNPAIIYTTTQFTGGGIYYSSDTSKSLQNVHNANGVITSGWEMAAILDPELPGTLFFNYTRTDESGKNNIDIMRTEDASGKKNAVIISDFGKTHGLKSYKVYGLYNSPYFPEDLIAYVLHFEKAENGSNVTHHKLYRTQRARDESSKVIDSWKELVVPVDKWIGDVEINPFNRNQLYLTYVSPDPDQGSVYALTYSKKSGFLKRAVDLSRNIASGVTGRFNLVVFEDGGEVQAFFAARNGVWYANAQTLRNKSDWLKVGYNLPHCKIYGLHYHPKNKWLTVGLFGRGVWRYAL